MSIAKFAWAVAVVALAATGMAVAGAVEDTTVKITDQGYAPARVEITAGQKVVFQNTTQKDHTVTSKLPAEATGQDKDKVDFDSGVIKPGASWEYTFPKEGTFVYYCKEEKSMTGTVVVNPAK